MDSKLGIFRILSEEPFLFLETKRPCGVVSGLLYSRQMVT